MGFVQLSRFSVLDSIFSCCLDFFRVIYLEKNLLKIIPTIFLYLTLKT